MEWPELGWGKGLPHARNSAVDDLRRAGVEPWQLVWLGRRHRRDFSTVSVQADALPCGGLRWIFAEPSRHAIGKELFDLSPE